MRRFYNARRILLSTQMVATATDGLLGPIYAIYVEKIGGDILSASGAYAIFGIVYGVLVYFLGKYTDKVKEQEFFIIGGFTLAGIGNAGLLLVQNPLQLFMIEALLGVAMAIMTPAHDALYTKHLDHNKFASEWGSWEGMYWITQGVSGLAGGILVTWLGFNALFVLMAALSFGSALYIFLLPRRVL